MQYVIMIIIANLFPFISHDVSGSFFSANCRLRMHVAAVEPFKEIDHETTYISQDLRES